MTRQQAIDFLVKHPAKLGRSLGFTLLTDDLHNGWITDMVAGKKDKTLQAHRGSYKTTCVALALAIIIVLFPSITTLFLRKTDADVKEDTGERNNPGVRVGHLRCGIEADDRQRSGNIHKFGFQPQRNLPTGGPGHR